MVYEALVISNCLVMIKMEIDWRWCIPALAPSAAISGGSLDMQKISRQLFLAGGVWVEFGQPLAAIRNQQISNASEITHHIIFIYVVSAYTIPNERLLKYSS